MIKQFRELNPVSYEFLQSETWYLAGSLSLAQTSYWMSSDNNYLIGYENKSATATATPLH